MSEICFLLMSALINPIPDAGIVEHTEPADVGFNVSGWNGSVFLQVLFYIFCLLAVLFLASKAVRWLGGKVGGKRNHYMKVVESLYLGPNRSIHLVLICNQLFLISNADRSLKLLATIEDSATIDELVKENFSAQKENSTQKSFSEFLKKFIEASSDEESGLDSASHKIEEQLVEIKTRQGRRKNA